MTRKLTLDLGMRWDLMDQGHEIWIPEQHVRANNPESVGRRALPVAWYTKATGPDAATANSFGGIRTRSVRVGCGVPNHAEDRDSRRLGCGVRRILPTYQYFTNSAILGVGIDQLVGRSRIWRARR